MNFFGNKRTCLSFKALFCKCRKARCKNSKTLFYGHSLVAYLTRWSNIEENNTLYPVEIKKTASPNSEDAKSLYITSRIKNVQIGQNVILCNTDKVLTIQKDEVSALAIPVEFI